MTSDELLSALEQNRSNIKALLAQLEADYEMAEDRDQKTKLASAMGLSSTEEKDAGMADGQRVAWLFQENAKALAAAAEEAGARNAKSPEIAEESTGLDAVGDALGGR